MAAYDVSLLGSRLSNASQAAAFIETLSSTRVIIAWQETLTSKRICTFEVDRNTGALTKNGSELVFYSDSINWSSSRPSIVVINPSLVAVFWVGSGRHGFCRTFVINPSTGVVTFGGSELEYDTSQGTFPTACLMSKDSTYAYILNASVRSGSVYVRLFRVTISNGAITSIAGPEIVRSTTGYLALKRLTDTKAILALSNNSGYVGVIDVDIASPSIGDYTPYLEYISAGTVAQNSIELMSESPMSLVNAYDRTSGASLRQLSVNTSTWAVSNLGTGIDRFNSQGQQNSKRVLLRIDDEHFIYCYIGSTDTNDLTIETRSFNPSTGALSSPLGQVVERWNTIGDLTMTDIGDGLFVLGYSALGGGFLQTVKVDLSSGYNPAIARRRLLARRR